MITLVRIGWIPLILLIATHALGQRLGPGTIGRFEGDGLRLELRADGSRLIGSVTRGDRAYPITATRVGDLVRGTFRSAGHDFAFTAEFRGATLVFKTGQATAELRRVSPSARDTRGEPEVDRRAKAAVAAAEQGLALDATFKHPLGFFFCHPSAWQRRSGGDGVLVLLPPDAQREVVLVLGDDADGVTRPDDPRALATADRIIAEIVPDAKQIGAVERKRFTKHDGAALTWAGKTRTGAAVKAKLWLTILRDTALAILVVTPEDRFDRRSREIGEVFATFGFTKPEGDPRWVGTWRHDTNYNSGRFSMSTSTTMILRADGTCARGGTKVAGGMEHTDSGGHVTGSSTVDGGSASRFTEGKWYGVGREITLIWPNGTEKWTVITNGRSMLFKRGKRTKELWSRVR